MPRVNDGPTDEKQPHEDSLAEQVRGLISDGQAVVQTELAFQKERIAFGLGKAKSIALLLLLALAVGFFALMALIVGLLLALTPVIGAWGALGAVVLGLCIVAGLCVFTALRGLSKARDVLLGDRSESEYDT